MSATLIEWRFFLERECVDGVMSQEVRERLQGNAIGSYSAIALDLNPSFQTMKRQPLNVILIELICADRGAVRTGNVRNRRELGNNY